MSQKLCLFGNIAAPGESQTEGSYDGRGIAEGVFGLIQDLRVPGVGGQALPEDSSLSLPGPS
ncbi:MAG: hypothetical protein ACUVRN_07170 [Candidatus Caldatribacteriaceae bacterium]